MSVEQAKKILSTFCGIGFPRFISTKRVGAAPNDLSRLLLRKTQFFANPTDVTGREAIINACLKISQQQISCFFVRLLQKSFPAFPTPCARLAIDETLSFIDKGHFLGGPL